MKIAAHSLFVILLFLGAARAQEVRRGAFGLLAQGNAQRLWIAQIEPGEAAGSSRTVFKLRQSGDRTNWRTIAQVPARARMLAERGDELLVVLDDGEWMVVADGATRSGASLPGGGDVVALAGDAESLWAVGEDRRAATRPSTTTAPGEPEAGAASSLALFSQEKGRWVYQSPLPPDVMKEHIRAMAMFERQPMLVISSREGPMRVYRFGPSGWFGVANVGSADIDARVALSELSGRPIVSVSAPEGVVIYLGGEKWSDPSTLPLTGELNDARYRAVAAGLGQLRVLGWNGDDRLFEQAFDADLRPAGALTIARPPPGVSTSRLAYIFEIIAMAALIGVMLNTLRRRPALQDAAGRLDELDLASPLARMAAGAIDAIPLIIALVIAAPQEAPDAAGRITLEQGIYLGAGLAVWLLHTTLAEVFAARSIGKALLGLRVIALDGSRPARLALLARNLLRPIDLLLLFPLLFMLLLPLRQRLGDLGAGTLVVRDAPREDPEEPAEL